MSAAEPRPLAPLPAVILAAFAGGMGWGIRGQYGHETGAMIAGLLLSLTLVLALAPGLPAASSLRVVAWGTMAIGFGGSMTYGQTVGLTQDAELVGNWAALRWGLLGLALKGGLWIGFAGLFLGLGLSGVRHRARDIAAAMTVALGLCAVGLWLFNEPFDPARKVLPRIYFSDDWRWEPGAQLKPRREVWGGYLFALLSLTAYAAWRRDRLAVKLAGWGVLGGAVGFPLGQCLQAGHAWNREFFRAGVWTEWDQVINWWNFMETTFGAVMGATLALGLWRNRGLIRAVESSPATAWLAPALEWPLLALHWSLLGLVEFGSVSWVDSVYDFGLLLGFLPVVLVAAGKWAPALLALPFTAFPICGKTLNHLAYEQDAMPREIGWILLVVVPLGGLTVLAQKLRRRADVSGATAQSVLSPALLVTAWLYFGLNYAFFRFPWPWVKWTTRTPNALVYTVCLAGLTWLALRKPRGEQAPSA